MSIKAVSRSSLSPLHFPILGCSSSQLVNRVAFCALAFLALAPQGVEGGPLTYTLCMAGCVTLSIATGGAGTPAALMCAMQCVSVGMMPAP